MQCLHCGATNPTTANFCRACGKPAGAPPSAARNDPSPDGVAAHNRLEATAFLSRRYAVYSHPTLGTQAIKVGFSWPALFFGVVWMLVHKMWALAGWWFLLGFLVALLVPPILGPVAFAMSVVAGIKGNRWRAQHLRELGYTEKGVVAARTADAATALSQAAPAAQA